MYREKRIIAIVPARGGSKGIKDKNIRLLAGKPLLTYSIQVALACEYIDEVVVSTDSENIRNIALQYGASVPFLRPVELATDEAKTIDVILHALSELQKNDEYYDYVMLLQPTQPIREVSDLKQSIEQVIDNQYDSLVSVCPVQEHPILMRTIGDDGKLHNILSCGSTVRRQDFPKVYKVNGSIYINAIKDSFNETTSLNDNQYPFVMAREKSIDIDNIEDLEQAEQYLNQRESEHAG